MNKRITSILLCFIMLFSMLVSAVPVYAATYESTQLKVVPDKTTANPGDIITYTIVMGPVSDMGAMQMVLDIPTGLTYVENSGKLADGLKNTLGFDAADWTEASIRTDPLYPGSMINGYASAADYECSTDTVLATFQCKVNDGFTGTVSVGLVKLEFGSCQTFEYHTDRFSVVPTAVTIEAKPVAVTGVTIDETLSVKTGESKTPSYTVNPAEATNKAVSFKSDNTAVATVNETTGEVTGVKEGAATITITTADGNFTDTCVVTVACSHANKTPVAEKASDCKNKGWDAYVKCDDCGQLFKADGTTEIAEIPFRELSSEHTGGTATCTAQAVCTVCSQPYGDLAAHSYTSADKKAEALKSEGNCRDFAVYYYSCSACGKVENNDSHTFNGDKDANTHVGGTALVNQSEANHKTQTDGYTGDTKCLGCGEIIGRGQPILAGAHTPANVWSTDGTHHWKECSVVGCGVVIDGSKAEHSSTGANVATCQKAAVCDVCNVSYGTVADHDWNTSSWEKDATGHWHKCNTAGCTEKNDFAGHTPDHQGGATEEYAIKCTICQFEIEAQLGHTHVFDKEVAEEQYLASKANCTDPAKYYKSCKCGEKGTEIFTSGEKLGHTEGTEWEKDATGHWHICTVAGCGVIIDSSKAAHTPDHQGGATEEYAIKCTICQFEIEAQLGHTHVFDKEVAEEQYLASKANCTDPAKYYKSCKCGEKGSETFTSGEKLGHTEGTEWEKDATGHWHICTVAGCGVVIDSSKAAHTPDRDAATETDPIKCSVCGFEIAPALGHTHAHGTDWKSDKDNHWNECACGDKANTAAHKDENTDGKCDVCEYNVGLPTDPDNPQTGDNSMMHLWIILLCVSGLGVIATTVLGKKRFVK